MSMNRLFTEHPASVGESYGEHLLRATRFGARMAMAGLACMLHALLPFVFVRTASVAVDQLHAEMQAVRSRGRQRSLDQLASAGE